MVIWNTFGSCCWNGLPSEIFIESDVKHHKPNQPNLEAIFETSD